MSKPRHLRLVGLLLCGVAASLLAPLAAFAKPYTLPELLELARKNSPSLAANAQATAVIEGQLSEARRSWYPSGELLSMVAPAPSIECQPDPKLVPKLPGQSDKEYREKNCYRTGDRDATLKLSDPVSGIFTRTEIRLVQPLYTFGKISTGIAAAKHGVDASRGREQMGIAELELNVKKAYWGWKAAREAAETLKEGIGHIDEGLKKTEENIKSGDASPTDRFRIQAARAEADVRLLEAQQKEAFAKSALKTLIAAHEDIEIDEEPLEALAVPKRPLDHYLGQAHVARPEVLALRNLVAAKRSLAELEWRKMLPDVVLIGAAQYAYASSVDNPYFAFASDPYNTASFGLVLALRAPLDFGPKSARWAQARAQAEESSFRQQEAMGGIDLEVAKAYSEVTEAGDRRVAIARGEKVATSWLTAVTANFEVGVAEAKDFADALLPYFNFRIRALQAIYDFNVAAATLSRVTGTDVTVGD